jgi:uncharacterized membrane protein
MIDQLFWICVEVLQLIGDVTGMGYNLANLVIFVILQPALIVLFFVLWRKEVRKNKEAK